MTMINFSIGYTVDNQARIVKKLVTFSDNLHDVVGKALHKAAHRITEDASREGTSPWKTGDLSRAHYVSQPYVRSRAGSTEKQEPESSLYMQVQVKTGTGTVGVEVGNKAPYAGQVYVTGPRTGETDWLFNAVMRNEDAVFEAVRNEVQSLMSRL